MNIVSSRNAGLALRKWHCDKHGELFRHEVKEVKKNGRRILACKKCRFRKRKVTEPMFMVIA